MGDGVPRFPIIGSYRAWVFIARFWGPFDRNLRAIPRGDSREEGILRMPGVRVIAIVKTAVEKQTTSLRC